MPVAQFGGSRGWGYDGVLLFAPHRAYGGPNGLKSLVDAAHERNLMVLLDVVYNHFGPDGNYLWLYASDFFDASRQTPWGAAIAYDKPAVRDFFIDNVLFWLEEYRFDGLRFDAINEIKDPSGEPLLDEIARTVHRSIPDRHVHLTTEDNRNITRLHERDVTGRPTLYTAAWNDDFHHAAHVVATAESEGYYVDYSAGHVCKLARALAEGFAYQGEIAEYWGNAPRGVPSAHLPPTAFIHFLQNHDQIGNRAFSERLTDLAPARAVETLTAILLLGPSIPLLFMGEEWGETSSFAYFTDFHGELADAVREGRRREFRRFARFAAEANREKIPDPNAESTFLASRLDWNRLNQPGHHARYTLIRKLLEIRHKEIVPRLKGVKGHSGTFKTWEDRALGVSWRLGDGTRLSQIVNVSDDPSPAPLEPGGRVLYENPLGASDSAKSGTLPGWSITVLLDNSA
jgi:maltooligosyltrehalose trehalohydrolase